LIKNAIEKREGERETAWKELFYILKGTNVRWE